MNFGEVDSFAASASALPVASRSMSAPDPLGEVVGDLCRRGRGLSDIVRLSEALAALPVLLLRWISGSRFCSASLKRGAFGVLICRFIDARPFPMSGPSPPSYVPSKPQFEMLPTTLPPPSNAPPPK